MTLSNRGRGKPAGKTGSAAAPKGDATVPGGGVPTHALLKDGTVIELIKDCGCITHEGPHWLHMDRLDRAHALGLLPPGGLQASRIDRLALMGFIAEEIARLGEKRYQMLARGIEKLLP